MRARGTGTIQGSDARGYRARLPGQNGAWIPGVFGSRPEAAGVLAAALSALAAEPAQGGLTLATWGETVLERRELAGQRGAAKSLSRWRCHVTGSPLGRLALVTVERADVVAFVDDLVTRRRRAGKGYTAATATERARHRIAPRTAAAILTLVRVVLSAAVDRRHIEANPAIEVQLPHEVRKRPRESAESTYLMPEEQAALLADDRIPLRERLAVQFALGTGARQSSQWAIRLADVDLARGKVTLRQTKKGRPHTVPLLPMARAAVEVWLPLRADEDRTNRARAEAKGEVFAPSDRLWPSIRGHARTGDHREWQTWTEAAIPRAQRHDGRHVRWHDLRHTCGTSLLCGWWGRRWSKEEVQALLDHESVTTTERYARLADDVLETAAAETHLATRLATATDPEERNMLDSAAPPARLERATFALGRPWEKLCDFRGIHLGSEVVARLREASLAALRLASDGQVELAGSRALAVVADLVAAVDAALAARPALHAIAGGRS